VSIEAIRAGVTVVRDQIVAAHQDVRVARERLAEARGTLTALSRNHSASLLPPEHARADEQLADCLSRLAACVDYLDSYVAGL
jgi:predicted  nucleic acid-binding Zn-ribbon protein